MRDTERSPRRCRRDSFGRKDLPEPDHRRASSPPGAPGGAGAATMNQALALCDLVADPRSGVTGVTVVGAPPGLVAALRAAARETGVGSATDSEATMEAAALSS